MRTFIRMNTQQKIRPFYAKASDRGRGQTEAKNPTQKSIGRNDSVLSNQDHSLATIIMNIIYAKASDRNGCHEKHYPIKTSHVNDDLTKPEYVSENPITTILYYIIKPIEICYTHFYVKYFQNVIS